MRYYLDEEFIEDGVTIDLISIGIVAEDGREYYAQSCEVDANKASPWVIEHVLPHLQFCTIGKEHRDEKCSQPSCPWRSREQIKQEILAFMNIEKYGEPEIWTYYGAYDHVAFCQLFGPMIDLPRGFPMHTMDIKQWCKMLGNPRLPKQEKDEHHALNDARWNRVMYDFLATCEREVNRERYR